MKRIAAPMIGGVITSGILELLLYPVIYVIWRKRQIPASSGASQTSAAAASATGASQSTKPT